MSKRDDDEEKQEIELQVPQPLIEEFKGDAWQMVNLFFFFTHTTYNTFPLFGTRVLPVSLQKGKSF